MSRKFRSILSAAVACRLRSVHPIGSHLSSGWDSSTVTATAAGLMRGSGRLTAYTAVPPKLRGTARARRETRGSRTKGSPWRQPSRESSLNLEHVLIRGTGRLDLTALDRHAGAFEYPSKTVNNFGWLESLYRDARNRGIRVMLSGGMGNRTVSHDGLTPYCLSVSPRPAAGARAGVAGIASPHI